MLEGGLDGGHLVRFRLRFLLQELELRGPEVVLGRSPNCEITLDDPLVSREHARILIHQDGATICDLGSRNGVRVNGVLITKETLLAGKDRIRLGTQELVFLVLEDQISRISRATGFMHACGKCGVLFPQESGPCPHCGHQIAASDMAEEHTVTGLVVDSTGDWTYDLLGDVIERALGAGRTQEAKRMLLRVTREIDERASSGSLLRQENFVRVCVFALRMAHITEDPAWVRWVFQTHLDHAMPLSGLVVQELSSLDWSGATDALVTACDLRDRWQSDERISAKGEPGMLERYRELLHTALGS